MRIALLNIFYYPEIKGGAEISVQKLAEELAKSNEVTVICSGKPENDVIINGVNVRHIDVKVNFKNKIERNLTRNYNIQRKNRIEELLREINPEVLHTNNLHAFSVVVWEIAKKLNIPVVHTLRDYTLIGYYGYETLLKKYCSNYVMAVTAPSLFTLRYFKKEGFFKKAKIQSSIPNAIDFDNAEVEKIIEEKLLIDNSEKVNFAYLGRISPEKGVDWLIRRFNNIKPNANLHIFGNGNFSDEVNTIIENNDNIFNHGFLNGEQLEKELQDIDVIVAPSLWDEPFGRIILDAYKSGSPVIVTARGGMPEVVLNNETGIILDNENDECLDGALQFLSDRSNIKKMLPNIPDKLKDYSIDRQAKSFYNIFASII